MDSRWKEMMAALAAGTKAVPFGDNGRVYAELEKELEVLRGESHEDAPAANEPTDRRAA